MYYDANNNNLDVIDVVGMDQAEPVKQPECATLLPLKKRMARNASFHRPWTLPSNTSKPNNLVGLPSSLSSSLLNQLSPNTAMAAATLISFPSMFFSAPLPPVVVKEESSTASISSPVPSEADSGYHEPTFTNMVKNDLEQPLDLSLRVSPPPSQQPACMLKGKKEKAFTAMDGPLCLSMSSPSSLSSSACSPLQCSASKHICAVCGKHYGSSSRFRAHCRRHDAKKMRRYQCARCLKCFVQRSSLRTHERIHTGEKPYHCSACDERFGDFSTFTKHRRTHTGEKPYSCPVCARCFSQSGNMHRHLKVVHTHEPDAKQDVQQPQEERQLPFSSASSIFAPFFRSN